MEGPSLFLAEEQLRPFKGRVVLRVRGNTKEDKERLRDQKVKDIFSWGKHLVFQFEAFAVRIHFLLFGTFEATVDDVPVTGDYKKKVREPRLALEFKNGHIEMYSCSVKIIEDSDLKASYDFSIDIMSPEWYSKQALAQMKKYPEEEIADVLLDQTIFAGVGNIIKNEVLSLVKINPRQKVSELSPATIRKIVQITREFSHQFYEWRKAFVLRKHLKIHRTKACPYCERPIKREKTGKRERWSYYCEVCQRKK